MPEERRINHDDLSRALEVVRAGGVILYPTDTVWGIGCDATDPKAVSRVFAIKRRDDAKALISLVADEAMLGRWVENVPDAAWQLIDAAESDTPMTIVYDAPRGLAPNLLADDGSAALRITHESFSRRLCSMLRHPLVSTSANVSGEPTPATFAEIPQEILDAVDYVVEFGRDETAPRRSSSVVKVSDSGVIKILRP